VSKYGIHQMCGPWD